MFEFENRAAVITGAAGGIGKAMAQRFARAGMKLVLSDIDGKLLADTSQALRGAGAEGISVTADVANAESVSSLADVAYDAFGSVGLLCNNAGVVPSGRHRAIWEFPLEDWTWAINVNVMGVVHGLRAFVPRMLRQGARAHIINTASIAGLVTGTRAPLYSATKHAVVRITEALHASLAERGAPIGVTLLCPGLVRTEIYQSERNRPDRLQPPAGEIPPLADAKPDTSDMVDPESIADLAFGAIRDKRFYVLTTSTFDDEIRTRFNAILDRSLSSGSGPW